MIPTKPKSSSKSSTDTLQSLVGNLTLLYIKAKNYHWNTTGPNFYGDHHTFDGIQEGALDWIDTVGERIRALQQSICACAGAYLEDAWYPEGDYELDAEGMKADMVKTLDCISAHIMDMIKSSEFDEVTSNILQDLCAFIDKQNYFVRSSL
ncbi:DNA-binding protein [Cronobacter phage A24]|uniref:DNA-binding protein n=1 Tax=Cronobacter phage A24 TaxID=2795745 RepID=A0A7T5UEJ3_9CAUD|nr:DNA-binding protein [Cronobacter phage A24]QQG33681.1 DNA-binding protein [Cronobacter phage A24]